MKPFFTLCLAAVLSATLMTSAQAADEKPVPAKPAMAQPAKPDTATGEALYGTVCVVSLYRHES